MNRTAFYLLVDYLRRTLGAWLLLAAIQLIQTSVYWALSIERLPLLGVAIAAMTYLAALKSPQTVLHTLPLSKRDVALFRWWASVGVPALMICVCIAFDWLTFVHAGRRLPPSSSGVLSALASCAALGVSATLPLPVLNSRKSNLSIFVPVWSLLMVGGLYGLPFGVAPRATLLVFVGLGLTLVVASYARALRGQFTRLASPLAIPLAATWLPTGRQGRAAAWWGWPVVALQILRGTVLLSAIAIPTVAVLRYLFPRVEEQLAWLFVSGVTVGGSILIQSWLQSLRTLRSLPVSDYRLAGIVYCIVVAPGLLTCIADLSIHQLWSDLGIRIPAYLLWMFAIVPPILLQRRTPAQGYPVVAHLSSWAPFTQVFFLPLWTSAVARLALSQRLPAWSASIVVIAVLALLFGGYLATLRAIRRDIEIERNVSLVGSPG